MFKSRRKNYQSSETAALESKCSAIFNRESFFGSESRSHGSKFFFSIPTIFFFKFISKFQTVRSSWSSINDKQNFSNQIFIEIFKQKPELKELFELVVMNYFFKKLCKIIFQSFQAKFFNKILKKNYLVQKLCKILQLHLKLKKKFWIK